MLDLHGALLRDSDCRIYSKIHRQITRHDCNKRLFPILCSTYIMPSYTAAVYHAEMAEPQNRQTDKNVIFGLALIKNVYR